MSEKTLATRILNKIDSWDAYSTVGDTFIPRNGEICLATVSSVVNGVVQPPAVVAKVGDGVHTWNELGIMQSIAADVYSWAKAATKPTYTAAEISGLSDFIDTEDSDTQYQLVKDGNMGIKLQSRPKTGGEWTDVGTTITLTAPTYELTTGTANGTVAFNGTDVKVKGLASAAYAETSAFDPAGAADAAKAEVIGETGDASTKMTLYGVKAYANAGLATKQDTVAFDPNSAYNADTNKAATLGSISREVGAAKTELIGTSADPSSANTINAAKKYADEKIASQISSVYKPAGSTTFANLPEPAASILGNVYNVTDAFEADTKFVTGEQGHEYPAGTNVAVIEVEDDYFYDVLAGFVDMSSYSTTEEMNAAIDADVAAAKTELIGTGDATATTIKAAVAEAKTYADGLNTAMDTRVDALEAAVGESGDISSRLTQAETDIDNLETLVGETAVATQISTAIGALETDDTAVANQFVTEVDLGADGLTVKRAGLTADAIPTITSAKISDFNTAADARVTAGINTAIADGGAIDTAVDGLISTAIAGVAGSVTAQGSNVVKSVSLTNGVLTGTTGALGIADVTGLETKLNEKTNDADLAAIAKTGNVNDLVQTVGDVIVFSCGSATVNADNAVAG